MSNTEQVQTALAFAQLGAIEYVKHPNGGWAEELSLYLEMAEKFEKEHDGIAENYGEDYWDSVDYYEALEIYWAHHKRSYFLVGEEAEAAS